MMDTLIQCSNLGFKSFKRHLSRGLILLLIPTSEYSLSEIYRHSFFKILIYKSFDSNLATQLH